MGVDSQSEHHWALAAPESVITARSLNIVAKVCVACCTCVSHRVKSIRLLLTPLDRTLPRIMHD